MHTHLYIHANVYLANTLVSSSGLMCLGNKNATRVAQSEHNVRRHLEYLGGIVLVIRPYQLAPSHTKPACEVLADLATFYPVIHLTTKVATALPLHRSKAKQKWN